MKVPLLDLKAQYATIKDEINNALIRVAESQYFILGPEVKKLEETVANYTGTKYAIGVSSGTDALLIALMAVGIKPGDEVILPTYSFFATAGVVARLNAVPVFVDSDPVTFNISPKDIEKKITPKTKAIIPVHLYGQAAEMAEIMDIAKKHNLKVIEDGAQAIGVNYKDGRRLGSIADIGCFSFFPSKNLGGFGDGGIVTTNDDALGEKLRILRVHGSKPKYYHSIIGGNFRIDEIQAAVLNVKFPHLDDWSAKRRQNADLYTKLFVNAGLAEEEGRLNYDDKNKVLLPKPIYKDVIPAEVTGGVYNYHIYNQYVIRVQNRDEMRKHLSENEIGSEIYYPVPFHLQECFKDLNQSGFPVAENAALTSIALPIYPELTEEMISFVVDKIAKKF
jgi:dTDP-4-amino-4,6-dideoxygalactose transaminase